MKTLIPNDFRDFLSIISLIGFLAIFSEFVLDNPFLSENLTSLFLIIGGAGLMVAGKVFNIASWLRDGLQKNEITMIMSVILGVSSMIIGIMMILGMSIPVNIAGMIGFIALGPAVFIFLDYITKNK